MTKSALLILSLFFSVITFSQNKPFEKVSIDDFITETQFGSDSPDDIEIIWWVPTEYWSVVFAQDPSASEAEKEGITNMLKDYVVVLTIKGKVGIFGGITYSNLEDIKPVSTVTYKGEKLAMVDGKKVGPDMLNFISMIKPMMSNMMGPMGENMHLFLYENPSNKSLLPIDPYSKESLNFTLGDFQKEVDLPLSSLLEEKICPDDKKELNGKWNFCPIHGIKLISKKN